MRAEIETRYHAEHIRIKTTDDVELDAMFLRTELDEEGKPQDEPTSAEVGPTVMICNPNAGYYEYAIEMQDQWIEFYRNNGLNIFLWNYRG